MGYALSIFSGLASGAIVGSAISAFYNALGVYTKLTSTLTYKERRVVEWSSFLGAVLGICFYLFDWVVGGGPAMELAFGLLSGLFIGIYIALIAEVVEYVPFLRRLGVHRNLIGVALIAFALGKLFGLLYYYIVFV